MKTTLLALAIHFPASLECSWSAVLHPASRDATLWVAHSARHSAVGIAPIAWSMGCCGSKAADVDERDNGADAASKELDRQMAEQQKEEAQVTKLLVLGTGESGKSTIFKQMKILYAVPDPPAKYIPVCRANLIGNAHMVHGAQHVHAEGSWWRAAPLPHLSRPVLAQRRSPRSRAPAPRGPDPGGPGLKGGLQRSSHAWWSAQAHAPALRRGRSLDEVAP